MCGAPAHEQGLQLRAFTGYLLVSYNQLDYLMNAITARKNLDVAAQDQSYLLPRSQKAFIVSPAEPLMKRMPSQIGRSLPGLCPAAAMSHTSLRQCDAAAGPPAGSRDCGPLTRSPQRGSPGPQPGRRMAGPVRQLLVVS